MNEDKRIEAWRNVYTTCRDVGFKVSAKRYQHLRVMDAVCLFIQELAAKAKTKRK